MKKYPATLLSTLVLTALSLLPLPDNPPLGDVPFIDKWVHFVMYGGIVFALWFDRVRLRCGVSTSFILFSILYAGLLGAIMEILQSCTDYRSGDWIDFYADVFGALLATPLCIIIHKLFASRH